MLKVYSTNDWVKNIYEEDFTVEEAIEYLHSLGQKYSYYSKLSMEEESTRDGDYFELPSITKAPVKEEAQSDECSAHQVDIYVGLKNSDTGEVKTIEDVETICQNFVDARSWCVSVFPCNYIYTKGREAGVKITCINYPRFPESNETTIFMATQLAKILKEKLEQKRVTICTPDKHILA